MTSTDFQTLVAAARAGSEEAAAQLVARYDGSLRRALRRELNRSLRLRPLYETIDFTQFAWQEFFRRRGEWREIETPAHLVEFLLGIGKNHLRDQRRRFDRQLCGRRQVPLEEEQAQATPDRGASVNDEAALQDLVEAVLRHRPALHRRIVELCVAHTCREIAEIVGRSAGQVRRVLAEIEAEVIG